MNYRVFMIIIVVLFLLVMGIRTCSEYVGQKPPFTRGLYHKSLSGRIDSLGLYKNIMTIRLSTSDSLYSFVPHRDPIRIGLYFWDVVQKGDSLWKRTMSDTLHTLGRDGIVYTWPFLIQDKFGRSYIGNEDM